MNAVAAPFAERTAKLFRLRAYWDTVSNQYGHWLYFLLFALFALLLLLGFLRPVRDRLRVPLSLAGAAGLLLLCAIAAQRRIDVRRGFIEDQNRRLEAKLRRGEKVEDYTYLPSKKALRIVTMGNDALAADYLWLTSLQYISSPLFRGRKAEVLNEFYTRILDFDPHWMEIHLKAGVLLGITGRTLPPPKNKRELYSNGGKDLSLAARYLWRTARDNPGNWRPFYQLGMLYIIQPVDPDKQKLYAEKARAWLEEALACRSLPKGKIRREIEDLKAKLGSEAGHYDTAAAYFWKSVQNKAMPEQLRQANAREWLFADSMVRARALKQEVEKYRRARGANPPSLAALYGGKRVPLDAYGFPLGYDRRTGKVWSVGTRARRALRVRAVIESLAGLYKNENGRFPADLKELSVWLRRQFSDRNKAGPIVTEALGDKLDCEANPLREPWAYDPEKGRIRLPPKYEAKALHRNAALVMEKREPPFFKERP